MAVRYFYGSDQILHIRSSTFELFYQHLLDIIDEMNIVLNQSLELLVENLYTGCSGFGSDISKFINNKNDLIFFANLVKMAIIKFEKEDLEGREAVKEIFWNFHKALLKYAENL